MSSIDELPNEEEVVALKIVITGNTPSQKNGKQIAFNPRTKRPFVTSSVNVKKWQASAAAQLKGMPQFTNYPVSVHTVFYRDSLRAYDLDNAHSTVMDALVKAGIILGDDNNHVGVSSQTDGGVDREDPRVEVFIDG